MIDKKWLRPLLYLTAFGAVICIAVFVYFFSALHAKNAVAEPTLIVIEKGTSTKGVVRALDEQYNLIDNPFVFEMAARFIYPGTLKAGEYEIPPFANARGILSIIHSGKTYQRKITIPEGLTVKQIAILLDMAEGLTGTLESLPKEGDLLPETYNYSYGDSRSELIARMKKAHDEVLDTLWNSKTDEERSALPFKNKNEAVILASIVERETGVAAERAKVAGVFINRLKKGMLLQSDPTVIYPLSDGLGVLDRPLWRSDWALDNPYNTYKYPGLPPAPIANPGVASLTAVFNPESHKYIYFVADGTGGHAFATSLKDHNNNVAKWRAFKKQKGIE